MVAGFWEFIGAYSNTYAELKATLAAILLCRHLHLNKVWIETDSQAATLLLRHSQAGHWTLQHVLAPLRGLLGNMEVQISHVFREANKVGDILANLAIQEHNSVQFLRIKTSKTIVGLLHLDKLEVILILDLELKNLLNVWKESFFARFLMYLNSSLDFINR